MRLNQATDYAFRAVLYLAQLPPGEVVEAQVIARHEGIPMRFLLKILRLLTKAGIIYSYRGVGGGYALARPPGRNYAAGRNAGCGGAGTDKPLPYRSWFLQQKGTAPLFRTPRPGLHPGNPD